MAKAGHVYHWKHGWIPLDGPSASGADLPDSIDFHADYPAEHKRVIADALGPLQKEFPRIGKVQVSMTDASDELAHAGTTSQAGARLWTSPVLFDEPTLREQMRSWSGMRIDANDAKTPEEFRRNVLIHEYGHMAGNLMLFDLGREAGHAISDGFVREKVTPRKMGFTVGDLDTPQERWKIDPLSKPGGWAPQSAYANESSDEFFAEAFADGYLHGDQASDSGKRALALARKYLRATP